MDQKSVTPNSFFFQLVNPLQIRLSRIENLQNFSFMESVSDKR